MFTDQVNIQQSNHRVKDLLEDKAEAGFHNRHHPFIDVHRDCEIPKQIEHQQEFQDTLLSTQEGSTIMYLLMISIGLQTGPAELVLANLAGDMGAAPPFADGGVALRAVARGDFLENEAQLILNSSDHRIIDSEGEHIV